MRRGILFIIAASFMLVATGCSSKSCKNSILQPDVIYEKALVNTKEAQIVRSLETKASVSATLLNEVFGDRYAYEDGVYLFIGIISERKISGDELPSFVHVKLNGKEPLEAKAIHRDDELYTLMPSVNRWGRYFLLKFPPSEAKSFKLTFGIDPYSPVELTFLRPTPRR
ncbi:MAG: hypothetical protein L3J42_03690 [Hydrogenimonas sp.]|nr:hypothetical protein [Hydrogenimonas sp.]